MTQISIILAEDPLSDNGVCCMNDMQQMSSNLGEADLDVCTEADEDDPDVDLYELLYGPERDMELLMEEEHKEQFEKLRDGECYFYPATSWSPTILFVGMQTIGVMMCMMHLLPFMATTCSWVVCECRSTAGMCGVRSTTIMSHTMCVASITARFVLLYYNRMFLSRV